MAKLFSKLLIVITSFCAAATMINSTAFAQRIGVGDEPIYVSSEWAEASENQFIWEQNVRIIQGKAILTADRIVGTLTGKGEISEIVATGKVRYSDGTQAITGKTGTYNEKERSLTISGEVIVTQG